MNTILVMIVIGIITSMVSKVKNNRGQSPNKPTSTNGIGEIRKLFQELTDNELSEPSLIKEPRKTSPVIVEQKTAAPQNLEKEYMQVRKESEFSRERAATSRQQKERIKELVEKDKQDDAGTILSEYPDAKTLVNGIVWSEILGEPRSKKPYFSKRG
ncbi:hypothetical protein [Neobacillus vireti]|uniref:Conjugal transfer protein n=1 Tax=Neobacillus vireti LMG 21834 TaxID=1131730 RepID=A0AB94IIZ7_9BACI|nr:hypothetical protein [Neobacillus vireti]ETI66997.1 hypothetical protein BAVI_19754 [Neobacillus vireti LMG 21834]KLT16950.1 hypothetical protein AA980_13655 [Neobacillus vireti]